MLDSPIPAPYVCDRHSVLKDWTDLNGHMNVAYYLTAFDQSFDEAYELIGITAQHLKQAGGTTFAAEAHVTYQRELVEGDPIRVTSQLIAFDAKRMHWIQCMYHRHHGFLAATAEWLVLYVDLGRRKVASMPEDLQQRLARIREAHGRLPRPAVTGRGIDIANRRPRGEG
jgi:acyl-CoA thioester hydrolase